MSRHAQPTSTILPAFVVRRLLWLMALLSAALLPLTPPFAAAPAQAEAHRHLPAQMAPPVSPVFGPLPRC